VRSELLRFQDWTSPVPPAPREVVSAFPFGEDQVRPPLLFVPGLCHAAWAFAEHWLDHTAARGFAAHAVSPRDRGGLRAYTHDVVQVAASLPRQAVLVGHGTGALVVARALGRYPARAAVLAAPVLDGWPALGAALRDNSFGTLSGWLRLSRRQLFGAGLTDADADAYLRRLRAPAVREQLELVRRNRAPRPVGRPPVLVVGSPDDRVVPRSSLDRTAGRYGTAPLLFPGMGHDLMLDINWIEPIDAILDWLGKELAA
jgi:pimeloyl-ACP methyl ester carboxylesterase